MPKTVFLGEPARERLDHVDLARGVTAADHGADRGAGDDVGMDALVVKFEQHADMRPAARGAGPERDADLRARRAAPGGSVRALLVGRCP